MFMLDIPVLPVELGVSMDMPETDDAEERKPPRELDMGRLSGKRALTMVIKSEGPRTRYGCTSIVSLKEVIDLAGSNFALVLDGLLVRKRSIMLSIWAFIVRGVEGVGFLDMLITTY